MAEMRYGLDITSAGEWGRPDQIAELAALAEDHGWDGVFCEDYLDFPSGGPTYDVWVTLGLVAQATTRLTLGTMVTPLPCRHPATVALQAKTVAAMSGGRFALGVGSGDPSGDPVVSGLAWFSCRAARGGPGRRPRAGARRADLGRRRDHQAGPRARALRWEGSCLYRVPPPEWEDLTPDDVAALRADAGRAVVRRAGRRPRARATTSLPIARTSPRSPTQAPTGGRSTCRRG